MLISIEQEPSCLCMFRREFREWKCEGFVAVLWGESEAGEPKLLKLQKFSFARKTFDNFFCAIVGFWLACLLFAIVARLERRNGGEKQTWRCFLRKLFVSPKWIMARLFSIALPSHPLDYRSPPVRLPFARRGREKIFRDWLNWSDH